MNRFFYRAVFLLGIACLLLSATQAWWLLPVDCVPKSGSPDQLEVLAAQPWVVPYFKGGSILLAMICLLFVRARRRWKRRSVILASFWTAALFSFPYWTIVADPSLAAQATWLQTQHENLTWLGGDLSTSFEYNNHPDKARVFIVDTPRRLSIVPLPTWSLAELNPSHFQELLQWLGYNNTFCQFCRRGWIMACVGSLCIWLHACVARGRVRSRYASLGLRTLGGTIVVGSVCAWISPFAASRHLANAADNTATGNYSEAVVQLREAANILPVIAEDTYFVAQLGLLEYQTGNTATPAAQLYQANLRERSGRLEQASHIYRSLVESLPRTSAVRREACRALLRSAICAFNSSANEKAVAELRAVLAAEPCNIKAIYASTLASLRGHQRAELERLVNLQYDIYSYCQFPNKKIVLADAQRQRLMAAVNDHDVTASLEMLQKMRKP